MKLIRNRSTCRGCGAEIGFIKTPNGKSMPVDLEEIPYVPAGGPYTYVTEKGIVTRGRDPQPGELAFIGYRSHFATCPKRELFRKR